MITGDGNLVELQATLRYVIDKPRVYLFEVGQPSVGGDPAVEQQPRRVLPRLRLPVVSETHCHLLRFLAQHVGQGKNVRGRGDVRRVDPLELVDVAQDGVELTAHPLLLLGRELETGQPRESHGVRPHNLTFPRGGRT